MSEAPEGQWKFSPKAPISANAESLPYDEEVPGETASVEATPEPNVTTTEPIASDVIPPLPKLRQIEIVFAKDAVMIEEFEKFKSQTIAGLKHLGLDVSKFFS